MEQMFRLLAVHQEVADKPGAPEHWWRLRRGCGVIEDVRLFYNALTGRF